MRPTGITAATYNLYFGADLTQLFGEADTDRLAARVATLWSAVEASLPTERMLAAAAILHRRLPDVVAVQEAALWRAGTEGATRVHDLLANLLDALAARGVRYRVAVQTHGFSSDDLSTALSEATGQVVELADRSAILVRDDPAVVVTGTGSETFADRLTVSVLGEPFDVLRGWCTAEIRVGQAQVRVVSTHLESYEASVRAAQAHELAQRPELAPGGPARLLLGDINSRPPACRTPDGTVSGFGAEIEGDAYETLIGAGLVDAWTVAHPDAECGGGTWGQAADLRNAKSVMSHRLDVALIEPEGLVVRQASVDGTDPDDRTPSGLWPSDHGCLVVELDADT